jgi:serine/threonine protein kinase
MMSAIMERRLPGHRDLKPSNIFLAQTATGEVVKILDFGLVKVLGKVDIVDSGSRKRDCRYAVLHGPGVVNGRSGQHGIRNVGARRDRL